MNSTYKNRPNYNSNKVVKNGFQPSRRIYKCKNCNKKFQNKTKENYLEGFNFFLQKGFEILSVTIDGRRGIPVIFSKYPIQIC